MAVFKDPSRPIEERVDDLVGHMTLEEKVSQMCNDAPGIPRLGVPSYDWWNECLHGVGRAGIATVFPQAIGLASTWNVRLVHRVATAISDEARAKHHEALRRGDRGRYKGLTFWTPNINIFRDPRWGRGQETYGEDPFLTARMAVAFVKGLQGDDPHYLKLVATPKHFAVHSGPEKSRHEFDVHVSAKDLHETYLPAFKACVKEAKAVSIMGAYNRLKGEPCCASQFLLQKILREHWGFDGYVVSDCGAIGDIFAHHKVVDRPEQAAAAAVRAGCDLNCGNTYQALVTAVEKGWISEGEIDVAVKRLFAARFRLGMFDPPERVPYAQIPYEKNDCEEHKQLALQAARESIVLLKNDNNLLPLCRSLHRIAVIGPNADDVDVLLGNYAGTPSAPVTILQGIKNAVDERTEVVYAKGCELRKRAADFDKAVELARCSDVVLLVMGLSNELEGEEGETTDGSGDRTSLDLPSVQETLLKAIHAAGKPTVLVLLNGSAVALNWADEHVPAIIEAWYPGQAGGTAVADVIFGNYNPAGRLPVTFYRSLEQLPPFDDYSMERRTYRFFEGEPLYAFGYGLSYSEFHYTSLRVSRREITANESVMVAVDVENIGHYDGDEVVQLYLQDVEASTRVPKCKLIGFERIHLKCGERKTVSFEVGPEEFALVTDEGHLVVEPGEFCLWAGGKQPNVPPRPGESNVVGGTVTVVGLSLTLDIPPGE